MCDCDQERGKGWKGWRALPSAPSMQGRGPWHDLSHLMSAEMPRVSFFPAPVFEQVMTMPEHVLNVTRMEMIVHMGTHIDSPRHFFLDGPALEDVPVDRLAGRGVIWPVKAADAELIEIRHLDGLGERLAPGDILFLNTGWYHHVGTPRYNDDHPTLSPATADWIVERGVKLFGMDTPTPDQSVARRTKEFNYPVHKRLLGNGVIIVEHLANLDPLSGKTVEIICGGLNIAGGDGAPARILAREALASPMRAEAA